MNLICRKIKAPSLTARWILYYTVPPPPRQAAGIKNALRSKPQGISGASDVTRTHDLLITNQLLYRLSYTSTFLTACTFYHMSPGMSTKKFDDYYLFSCMKKCRISAQAVDFFRFLSVVQNLHCYTPRKTRAVSGFPARGEDQSSYIFVTICLHNFLPASCLL